MNDTEARRLVAQLHNDLGKIVDRDPEQEVRGMAIPVLDEALKAVKGVLAGDPIVARMSDVISVETIDEGDPLRAVDVLMVVSTLKGRLGPEMAQATSSARRSLFAGPDQFGRR